MAGKLGRSGPPGNANARKHGAFSLIRALGGGGLDRRTGLAKTVREIRDALVADLGAERWEALPVQKRIIIERIVARVLFCRAIETWLLDKGIIGEDGSIPPALGRHYTSIAEGLRRDLALVGIERVARPIDPVEAIRAKIEAARKGGGC